MTQFVALPRYVHSKREATLLSDVWHGHEFWRHADGRLLLRADGAWYEVKEVKGEGRSLFGLSEEFNQRTGRISK